MLRLFDLVAVPDGILYDEAYNTVDAARAFSDPTPFFHGNFGREAGFIYLQALAINLFGYNSFAVRFPSAALGLLTVAVAYPLFTRLFGRAVALLSVAWLSWSLWHVIFSRIGLRAIALPLVLALTFYCYSRGVSQLDLHRPPAAGPASRGTAWSWFALAGVFLGFAQYTYTAARFAPLALALAAALRIIANPRRARDTIVALGISALAAFVVFLPLGLYFVSHPADFSERARQVSVLNVEQRQDLLADLKDSAVATVGIFGARGDGNWDRNVSGLPALDPPSFALFLVGIGVALRRWRSFPAQLVLSWFATMLIPHLLTSAYLPNYLRATGVLPVMFVFPALGLDRLVGYMRQPRGYSRPVVVLIVLVGMAAGTVTTAWRYFHVWAHEPTVHELFHSSLAREFAAGYQVRLADRQSRIYVAVPGAAEGLDPVSFFLARSTRPRLAADLAAVEEPRPFVAEDSLVIPPRGQRVHYLIAPPMALPAWITTRHLAGAASSVDPAGLRTITMQTPALAIEHPFEARWDDLVDVVGYSAPTRLRPGDTLQLVLYWKVRRQARLNVAMFAHLVDITQSAHGKVDSDVSLLHERLPDEVVAQLMGIPVARTTPTGAYWISVGLYQRPSAARLRVLDSLGRDAGDSFLLGPLKVSDQESSARAGESRAASAEAPIQFGRQIGLQSFALGQTTVRPGAKLVVDLRWLAQRTPAADYTVFLQLLDNRQQILGQVDAPPRQGAYPTSLWDPGEIVADRLELPVSADAVAGQGSLIVGFYDRGGNRLPASTADGLPQGDFAVLGAVEVLH